MLTASGRGASAAAALVAAIAVTIVAMLAAAGPARADTPSFYKIAHGDFGMSYLVNPDGTGNEPFREVFGAEFDWTPDGQKFVYRSQLSPADIYIRNQDGASFPVGVSGQQPALSPDGTKIAYARGQSTAAYGDPNFHRTVIDVVDLNGNFLATLGPGQQPTWSPDGTKIAFAKRGQRTVGCGDTDPEPDTVEMRSYGLAVGPATGGSSSWLLEPNTPQGGTGGDGDVYWQVGRAPDWSPDGTEIAVFGVQLQVNHDPDFGVYGVCGSEQVGGLSNNDIFKVPAGGGEPENLTAGAAWIGGSFPGEPTDMHPSFSPDGTKIAFSSDRNEPRDGGVHSLWKMNADGGDPQLVLATARVDSTDWMTALPVGYTVRIQAPDATATEEGETPGTFTIQRTGATDGDLEVTIKLSPSSTATSGSDFAPIPTTVTIPDGTDLANLAVYPIDDDVAEPDETIVVEIVSAQGMLVGEPAEATIKIADNDAPSGGSGGDGGSGGGDGGGSGGPDGGGGQAGSGAGEATACAAARTAFRRAVVSAKKVRRIKARTSRQLKVTARRFRRADTGPATIRAKRQLLKSRKQAKRVKRVAKKTNVSLKRARNRAGRVC